MAKPHVKPLEGPGTGAARTPELGAGMPPLTGKKFVIGEARIF